MEYTLKRYYQVNLTPVLALRGFMKDLPKDDYEAYAGRVIEYIFLVQNKIDEVDGANERPLNFLKHYKKLLKSIKKYDIIKSKIMI